MEHVKVYDNNNYTWDRYTVCVYVPESNTYDIYSMSENALMPDGVNYYSHSQDYPYTADNHEKEVEFTSLPIEVRKAIQIRLV